MISAELDIETEGFLLTNAVKGPQPVCKKTVKNNKQEEYTPNIICEKCGMIGHLISDCKATENMISQYENDFNQEILEFTTNYLKEYHMIYAFDEFGPYREVDGDKYHSNETFANSCICLNCGQPGHQWNTCKHMPFDGIFRKITSDHNCDSDEFAKIYEQLWDACE